MHLLIDELNKIDMSLEVTSQEMIDLITTGKGTITFNSEDLPFRRFNAQQCPLSHYDMPLEICALFLIL